MRATAFFAAHGIVVQRVLSDSAFAYRNSVAFRTAGHDSGAVQRFIQPRRLQTNGKVERFNRALLRSGPTFARTPQTSHAPAP